ncbi:tRNA modification GTPase MnmE [Thiorhodovibrio litoralis]|nr:tRNA modification GTPase MnmE [Thiorhodovibrio litoralis]
MAAPRYDSQQIKRPLLSADSDTIAAIATPPGRGGIGVVRVSGQHAPDIAAAIIRNPLPDRQAVLCDFRDGSGESIDQGIAVLFMPPRSYTGEPVLELQAHGSPVVLDLLLARIIALGARLARPGEFTERAFINGKIDLTQAEAVADLISSTNQTQARLAQRTLAGALAEPVDALRTSLIRQRTLIEAGLDFSDEDIELSELAALGPEISRALADVEQLLERSHQGERVRDGMTLVIAGPPNAGKSSLLNRLSGQDSAIVTATPGTTRDLVHADIHLEGMPLHLIDTAGLRESQDAIEQEGMRRAREQIASCDLILWVYDATEGEPGGLDEFVHPAGDPPLTLVRNKIDLLGEDPGLAEPCEPSRPWPQLALSAQTGAGLDLLKQHLKQLAGYQGPMEGAFIARRRHLTALEETRGYLIEARSNLAAGQPPEIIAEDLRQAQHALGEITGEFTSEDLLGEIFASFCIGK